MKDECALCKSGCAAKKRARARGKDPDGNEVWIDIDVDKLNDIIQQLKQKEEDDGTHR